MVDLSDAAMLTSPMDKSFDSWPYFWASVALVLASTTLVFGGRLFSPKVSTPRAADRPVEVPRPAPSVQSGFPEDPVRWSFIPSTGILRASTPESLSSENDFAFLNIIALHRPTYDASVEKSGHYPYASYFRGRKRLWEVRVQVRFKKLPTGRIFIGLETRNFPSTAARGKAMQRLLLRAIQAAVGSDFYQSDGDNPGTTAGEAEPPCFGLPLWAADQLIVTEAGATPPDLTQDLSGMGIKRTDGLKPYRSAMEAAFADLSLDRVYTFSFWGVSQFLDVGGWQVRMPMGIRSNINSMLREGPIFVVFYELADRAAGDSDMRHLVSQKRYIFNVALWSTLQPPAPEYLRDLLGAAAVDGDAGSASDDNGNSMRMLARPREGTTRCAPAMSGFSQCFAGVLPAGRKTVAPAVAKQKHRDGKHF